MQFNRQGSSFSLLPEGSLDIHKELPVGTYTVRFNNMTGQYFLEVSEDFKLPSKLYGKTVAYGKRILNTFETKGGQIGVFLTGTKGSGKTLLAKWIAINSGYPCILINTPFCDDGFMQSIQGIAQKAVIIFDEFEKVYDKKQQERILTLFDGVYTAHNKIIILTANDRWSVGDFFHNRPGRLRYALSYSGLDAKFILEYCKDNLRNQKYTERIIKLSLTCNEFNFDQLQAIVEELNMYCSDSVSSDEEFDTTVELLNVKASIGASQDTWHIISMIDRLNPKDNFTSSSQWRESPIMAFGRGSSLDTYLSYILPEKKKDEEGTERDQSRSIYFDINKEDLVSADVNNGSYTFLVKSSSEEDDNGEDHNVNREILVTIKKKENKSHLDGFDMHFAY
jgi:hypothetical protein